MSHRPVRPLPLPVIAESLPAELTTTDRWLVWRYVWKEKGGKWDKPPLCARGLTAGSSTNPATWSPFHDALAAYRRGGLDGLGFALADEDAEDALVAIDLDKCRDALTAAIDGWARLIVEQLRTCTEVSPSGLGLRLLLRGRLPRFRGRDGRKCGPVEAYRSRRYVTLTGQRLDETPAAIERRPSELSAFLDRHFPSDEPKAQPRHLGTLPLNDGLTLTAPTAVGSDPAVWTDEELIGRALRAKNGPKFAALWAGDFSGYKSRSEADAALVAILHFWARGDERRVDRLVRESGLYRSKWDRDDYREGTFALVRGGPVYDPTHAIARRKLCLGTATGAGQGSGLPEKSCYQVSHASNTEYEKVGNKTELLRLKSPPPSSSCPAALASPKLTLWSRHDRSLAKVITAPCKRWTCVVCGRRLAHARATHYASRLSECTLALHVAEYDTRSWPALKVRIARQAGCYLRVDPGDGRITVFSTVAIPEGQCLAPPLAVGRLDEVIDRLPLRAKAHRGKPVFTSSKAWKPPPPARHEKEWRLVNEVNTDDPGPVVAVLEGRGIEPELRQSGGLWQVLWSFPPRMGQLDVARVFNELRAIGEEANP